MSFKGFGQRAARTHALVHVVENPLEHRIGDAATENVERLHERHASLEQCGELLIEDQEFAAGHTPASRQANARQRAPTGLVNSEDQQPLLFELPPEPRLAIGDVGAFDDVPARCAEPAAILHRLGAALQAFGATSCSS